MKSMTGFGTAEGKVGKGRVFIEIKSVNHRYCEVNTKIPGRMAMIEPLIKKELQKYFLRGKIDVFIKEKQAVFGDVNVNLDIPLARKYKAVLSELKRDLKIKSETSFLEVIPLDRVIRVEEKDGSYVKFWKQIARYVNQAAREVKQMRKSEGAFIENDQKKRIAKIDKLVLTVERRSKSVRGSHIDKIRTKVANDLRGQEVDEQRLMTEAAFLNGRQDIAEEIVRLKSHSKQYMKLLKLKGGVGRKLDFLLQEMNREINTIGAKASDAKISQIVVDCKAELERLREQIQNIE